MFSRKYFNHLIYRLIGQDGQSVMVINTNINIHMQYRSSYLTTNQTLLTSHLLMPTVLRIITQLETLLQLLLYSGLLQLQPSFIIQIQKLFLLMLRAQRLRYLWLESALLIYETVVHCRVPFIKLIIIQSLDGRF